ADRAAPVENTIREMRAVSPIPIFEGRGIGASFRHSHDLAVAPRKSSRSSRKSPDLSARGEVETPLQGGNGTENAAAENGDPAAAGAESGAAATSRTS